MANCGLAGLLVVAMAAGTVLPRLAPMAVLWWCGALLAGPWGTVPLLVFVAGAATALALLAATGIHGAALAVGILLAAATRPFQRPAVTAG